MIQGQLNLIQWANKNNLSTLTWIENYGGYWQGFPRENEAFLNFTCLNLMSNQLEEIISEIGNLTALTELILFDNKLKKLPNEIGHLTNLTKLYLNKNNLQELPNKITSLTNLKEFSLLGNKNLKLSLVQQEWISKLIANGCNVKIENHLLEHSKHKYTRKENEICNNPSVIIGNWKIGWALDIHTLKSIPLGNGKFDTTYSETGKALNELKYHQNYNNIHKLANEVIEFLKTRMVTPYLDVIIPTPPSKQREIQPVEAISEIISDILNIPIDKNYITKIKNTSELKSIEDPEARKKLLNGAFNLRDLSYQNKKILLFDDLFRSGSTLKEITHTLYHNGKVQDVYVVTLTKTRSKR